MAEIKTVAKYLSKEAKNSDMNHILVGDFNIKAIGSPGFNALQENGFEIVQNRKGTNRDRTKFYDQISFRPKKNELELLEQDRDDRVIQFFDSVYRVEDYLLYKPVIKKMIAAKLKKAKNEFANATSKTKKAKAERQIKSLKAATKTEKSLKDYYEEWRTFQMSDHLPLWVEIKINFSDNYLKYLKTYGEVLPG